MNAGIKKKLIQLGKFLVILYLAGGIFLYFFQESILFHPTPLAFDHRFQFDQSFTELNIPFEKHNLSIVKFTATGTRKGIVLFFHGNRNNVERYRQYPPLFTRNGYEIWMIDYPGFGKTTGSRTEKILYQQALVMYDLAMKETNSSNLVIYGKSMGTGIASFLAANRNCKKLILETPYQSIAALAKHYFPVYPTLLRKYSFPVQDYLEKIRVPITIFHGTDDGVVPYRQGKELAASIRNAELITIEKGEHNNLFGFRLYQQKMDSLLLN